MWQELSASLAGCRINGFVTERRTMNADTVLRISPDTEGERIP